MISRSRRVVTGVRRSKTASVRLPQAAGLAVLLGLLVTAGMVKAPVARAQTECQDNLLANGGFEDGFSGRGRLSESVADGWTPWYERFPGTGGVNYVPDYAPLFRTADAAGTDVLEGLWSQEMATAGATHTAGLWQRVSVPAQSYLAASVSVRAWASAKDDPYRSEPPGTYVSLLGLDPMGGTDPNATSVQWTAPISVTDAWVPLALEAPVEGDAVTVFLRGQPIEPLAHNVSRWDAACLRVLGPAEGPLPTATSRPWPTRTPLPPTPGPGPTRDSATQTSLDVALFLDASATAQASSQPPAEQSDTGASPGAGGSGPGVSPKVVMGMPTDAQEASDRPAAALGPPAVEPLRDGPDADQPAGDEPPGVLAQPAEAALWQGLVAALADRIGILFLGLAALLLGAWLGRRRGTAHDRGGGG